MFPDLTSDDIFRIETKRLWLRWPRASDAASIAGFASLPQTARMTAAIPHPYPPGEAERFILQARADNANKSALVLAMTLKSNVHQTIGLVSVTFAALKDVELGYVLAPAYWGRGLTSEAVKALVATVFSVTPAERIVANSRTSNPASRRVLEKSGFSFVDTGLDFLPARGGMHPCDRFVLDRKSWAGRLRQGNRSQPMPPMAQQGHDISDAAALAAAARRVEG